MINTTKVKMGDKATCNMVASPLVGDKFKIGGRFHVEHFRNGELIHEQWCYNHVTDEGLKRILDVMFHATTQTATWYVGVFNTNTTPDGSETYDVPVFTESTDYSSATRPEYVEAAATAGFLVTNTASKASFTVTTGGETWYGAALFSVSTKGNHAAGADNVLFSCAKFGTARATVATDVFNITYELSGADDGV